jgi:predicted nucleic acid-binding protein
MARAAIRVYADTSVFGGAFDEEFATSSIAFFDQVRSGGFQLVVSPVVESEIAGAPQDVRNLYLSISAGAEMLPVSEEVVRLQEVYLQAGIVTRQWAADALHVAHATVHGCRMIISWNFGHIVHYEKMGFYNAVNVKEGYSPIGIHTPAEVIQYEDKDV